MKLQGSSVPDVNGSPMQISAIVNYRIVDGVKAIYAVDHLEGYIFNQGLEVLKAVCGLFAFRTPDGKDSLMGDTDRIDAALREILDERCSVAGVDILGMELMEVAYAPEVA